MRIALFTSNRTTIPPQPGVIAASAYLTGLLADGLVERGHDVTLYAPKGSVSKAKIIDLDLPPALFDYALNPGEWVKNMNIGMKLHYLSNVFSDSDRYDCIHLQTEPVYLGFGFTRFTKTPAVATNHNIFVPEEKIIFSQYPTVPIVTISNFQRSLMPDIRHSATVYDGIPVGQFPFAQSVSTEPYLGFIGRLVAVKGVENAIAAAQGTGKPLVISGIGTEEYISTAIRPHVCESIRFIGAIDKDSMAWYDFYQHAKALLVPIEWDEPFGLVMVEAMATGTPVIAYARGSVPEIIEDGVTGFIVNASDDMVRGNWIVKKTGREGLKEAIELLWNMDSQSYVRMRSACRERVEKLFSIDRMVDGYCGVYQSLL